MTSFPRQPVPATADAGNRAWRTFAQGLLFDVAGGVLTVLVVVSSDSIEWTSTYWLAIASAVGKSAIVAGISYLARSVVPPKV